MDNSSEMDLVDEEAKAAWDTFKCFLGESGHRVTNQRRAIFTTAYEASDHFTAEDLWMQARQVDSSVSRATVYRTIPILIGSKVIREIDVGKEHKFYTADREKQNFQAQIICKNCDKIQEIDAPFMEWYGKAAAEKLGLVADSQRLQVYAHCLQEDCPSKA